MVVQMHTLLSYSKPKLYIFVWKLSQVKKHGFIVHNSTSNTLNKSQELMGFIEKMQTTIKGKVHSSDCAKILLLLVAFVIFSHH